MSDEERQKMREALQKALGGRNIQDVSQEERQRLFAKLRETMRPAGAKPGEGDRDAPRGGPGMPPAAGPEPRLGFFGGGGSGFSEKELAEAKLPLPPEEDSQMEVLLRPGLLADVEITVERIPDAIYIPTQAVFEKDGKPIVYVKSGERFEERSVKLYKRSEATMVVSEGLRPGELVALADPYAGKSDKKREQPGGSASPMGAAPTGGRS